MRKSVVRNRWNVFRLFYDGRPGVVAFDIEAAEQATHTDYPQERRILATFGSHEENDGMPTETKGARVNAFEDALVAALDAANVDGWLVGRLTTGGSRVFLFQLNQPELFDATAVRIVREYPDLKPRVAKAMGWQFFEQNIRPTFVDEMQMSCARVLEGLQRGGSDLSQPHVLDHTFVGSASKLATIAQYLGKQRFSITHADGPSVVASKISSLSIFAVTELACEMKELAEKSDVSYSGWGAAVVARRRS